MTTTIEAKVCTTCGELKPLEDFHASPKSADGKAWACKECARKRQRAYNRRPEVLTKRRSPHGYLGTREAILDYDRDRFLSFVEKSDGCWLWRGPQTHDGYGRFGSRLLRKRIRAHIFSKFLETGEVPSLLVCHQCDNPLCVNPAHLFIGTHLDNNSDCSRKGRARVETKIHRGEANGRSKLTEEEAKRLRDRARGGESPTALAVEFGVSATVVAHIRDGKLWKCLA
jgi:hypothetical protein